MYIDCIRPQGIEHHLMLALPELHQSKAHWRYAGELLKVAAQHGEKYAVMDARAQFARALTVEGLISPEVAQAEIARERGGI